MKIVQINSVSGVGSTGRIAVDISSKLDALGIENYILYGVGQSENTRSIKVGGKFNTRSHQIKTRLFGKHGFYSKNTTHQLIHRIKKINPDIIHLHNIHGHYLNIEILFNYLKESKVKVVWTLHDCWSFTGHCAYFDYVQCDKWKTGCGNCPALKEYPRSLIFDRSKESFLDKKELFTKVDNITLVTPSKWLSGLVSQSYMQKFPLKVINNGIDLDVFKPTRSNFRESNNLTNEFIILGVAGVWEKRKGYQFFLELSSKLKKNEVIVLVGLDSQLQKKLPSNIIGITKTESISDLAKIYSAANVFLNPTLEDNFPTTNLEALACGTPIITFDTGGSPESIDEETGFVIEKQNLSEAIRTIEVIQEKGSETYLQACVKRANKFYNKEKRYDEYLQLYEKINEGYFL